jgi:hypothetical protein
MCKINEAREHIGKQRGNDVDVRRCVTNTDNDPTETVDRPAINPVAFYGIAGEAVTLIEPHTDCDPSAVYLQLITLAGCYIGHDVGFDVGRKQYANLFACIVGESAEARKGTSLYVAKQILKNVIDKPQTLSGIGSGEGLVDAIKDIETKVKDDGTFVIVDGTEDKRCIVEATEFGSILKVLKREGNTLSPILRNAWDSDTIRSVTKGSKLAATDPHVSIIAHVTTSELLKMMKGSDELANGFANRFLWSFAKRSKRITLPVSIDSIDGIDTIRKRFVEAIEKAKQIRNVTLSDEARAIYDHEYDRLTRHRSGLYGKVSQRSIAQVIRLALIITLLDGSTMIDASHIWSAIAIWDYCDSSARYVFDIGDDDDENTLMKIVLTKINTKPGQTKSKLRPNGHTTASEMQHAIDCLLSTDHVHEIDGRFYPGASPETKTDHASVTSSSRSNDVTTTKPIPTITKTEYDHASVSSPRSGDDEATPKAVTESTPPTTSATTTPTIPSGTIPATITELLDYRNTHPELRFVRDEAGIVGLESTEPIPPPITLAVRDNQHIVSLFVSDPNTVNEPQPVTITETIHDDGPAYDDGSIAIVDEQFYRELIEMRDEPMNNEKDNEKKI